MKKAILVVLLCCLVPLLASGALLVRELLSLASLRRVDAHPLYEMRYLGDYGFSEFLRTGAASDADIERFVMRRLLKGVEIDLNIASAGCSAFTAYNERGERIYARNFDFDYAPALLLRTDPSDGFASIGVVNLAFAGYGEGNLPDEGLFNCFLTLAGPFLPFDGVNEKGVAIALLAVPHAEPPREPGRIMLNTTTLIRLVLDRADCVQQALDLLDGYTLYFSGGVECHYLITDASGDSAVVEFLDGEMCVTRTEKNYQIATNFILYGERNEGEGGTEFVRYDTIEAVLSDRQGVISEADAMRLLAQVKIPGRTQWSVVYNLRTGDVAVCMAERYDSVWHTSLYGT